MMKNSKLLSVSLVVALLSSCASYQAPISGPVATLQFPNSGGLGGYHVFVSGDPYRCNQMTWAHNSENFQIPVNGLFTFVAKYNDDSSACQIAASFYPKQNQVYVGTMGATDHVCSLNVYQKVTVITGGKTVIKRVPVRLIQRKLTGMDVYTAQCKDAIATTRQVKSQGKLNLHTDLL